MTSVLAFSGVRRELAVPQAVHRLGLAFGGVYALSGVGPGRAVPGDRRAEHRVRRDRCCGRPDRLLPRQRTRAGRTGSRTRSASLFGGAVNLAYGVVFGPAFARRDPLVKMMGTLGLALILLGLMAWRAPAGGAFVRFLPLPTTNSPLHDLRGPSVNLTQIIALVSRLRPTAGTTAFLRFTKLGTAMRALANDREITATLGVPGAQGRGGRVVRLGPRLRRGRAAARRPLHLARLLGAHLPRHLVARRRADRPPALALGDALRRPRRRLRPGGARAVQLGDRSTAPRRRSCWRSWRCS